MGAETTVTDSVNAAAESTTTTADETWRAVVDGAVNLLENLGEALIKGAQDLSQLMVIRVDEDTRAHLDMLVESNVVRSRGEGVTYLLEAGIKAKGEAFAVMAAGRERIAALRAQLREGIQGIRTV